MSEWKEQEQTVLRQGWVWEQGPLRVAIRPHDDGRNYVHATITFSHFDNRSVADIQREVLTEVACQAKAFAQTLVQEVQGD